MDPQRKMVTREQLAALRTQWRSEGRRVGFTSGVFDLMHAGHAQYLTRAKEACDILVVAVNSDASVRANKGPLRPIIPERERLYLICSLASVDYAFLFDERNNERNTELLLPDLYIKASDYTADKLRSARRVEEAGGKLLFIPLREGWSSTAIIERIEAQALGRVVETLPQPPKEPRPAVFVDRDGTIIEQVEYLSEPEKLQALPGALEALKRLRDAGFLIIIVTNQPGIGFGYFAKEDFFRVTKELLRQANRVGALIDKIYYCPHTQAEGCACRKPSCAFLERAAAELNVDLGRSFMIGDTAADVLFGKNGGLRSVLVHTGFGSRPEASAAQPDFAASDLPAAADWILTEGVAASLLASRIDEAGEGRAAALEAIGKAAGKLGHDFNNLLGSMQCSLEMIESTIAKGSTGLSPIERPVKLIRSAIRRATAMTSAMRGFVRPGPTPLAPVRVRDVVRSVMKLIDESEIVPFEILLNLRDDPVVCLHEFQVGQMLMNLCLNAIEAMNSVDERVLLVNLEESEIAAGNEHGLPAGRYARVSIVDHGKGMSDAQLAQAFNPFFSTKPSGIGKGMGLGLAMSQEIMRKHGGAVVLASIPECGTVVHLYFPVVYR